MDSEPVRTHLSEKVVDRSVDGVKAWYIPIHYCEEPDAMLQHLVNSWIIKKAKEPTKWCSPATCVPKTSGGVHVVTDFRGLNQKIFKPI